MFLREAFCFLEKCGVSQRSVVSLRKVSCFSKTSCVSQRRVAFCQYVVHLLTSVDFCPPVRSIVEGPGAGPLALRGVVLGPGAGPLAPKS